MEIRFFRRSICLIIIVLICAGCGSENLKDQSSDLEQIVGQNQQTDMAQAPAIGPKEDEEAEETEVAVSIEETAIQGRTKEETELIQKVLARDKEEFQEFLTTDWEFPHVEEAVLITAYDFTGDGEDEIILSKLYRNVYAQLSYNYVYGQDGGRMLEFAGGHPLEMQIVNDWNGDGTFLVYNKNHYFDNDNANIYTEIEWKKDKLTGRVSRMELDRRLRDYEREGDYCIFRDLTREEEEKLWFGSDGADELVESKEYVLEDNRLETYKQLFEESKPSGISVIEAIRYAKGEYELYPYDYCKVDEFTDMEYYLLCDTQLSHDIGPTEWEPVIVSSQMQFIEPAKQLYWAFRDRLPLDVDSREESRVNFVSTDCKWIRTERWTNNPPGEESLIVQNLFYENKKVKETSDKLESFGIADASIIVRGGDSYQVMDERQHEKLAALEEKRYEDGYQFGTVFNEEGMLLAGIRDEGNLLTIRTIEDGAVLWDFSLQDIRGQVREIREDKLDGDSMIWIDVLQFVGNEKEGWLTVQAGRSSFFRIAYPSGKTEYLGEYMYYVTFSPDGKYAAYSGVDYDNGVDMEPEEEEKIAPGIYIREVKTGRTAYMYWNTIPEYRSFMWIRKEDFEAYMG